MKELLNRPTLFIEITMTTLKVLGETRGLELALERLADGKLTPACREKTVAALVNFLGRKSWQPRARAICGLSAQGVSLRKITLPVTTTADFDRVLRLQIESEFPLSPDELAWGWREVFKDTTKQEILVAAVRKNVVEEYATLFQAAGLNPEFTLAAWARSAFCPMNKGDYAVLEMTETSAELLGFESGIPVALRNFATGNITAEIIQKTISAKTTFVFGATVATNILVSKMSATTKCQRIEVGVGAGFSAATLGLKKLVSENQPMLWLQTKRPPTKTMFQLALPENRFWLVRGAALLVLLLLFPFAEALLLKPFLAWRVSLFTAKQQAFLSVVEPERKFLLSLKESQPPYFDAIYLFSKAIPPGSHLDSVSLNQRGEISIKAVLPNGQAVTDFRETLMASGFFANLTVEEQTPVQNQPRVNVRIAAQWKANGARAVVKVPLPVMETNKTDTNVLSSKKLKP